jgi:hypothetical protein
MITYPLIKFSCRVSGKNLIAEVIASETDPGHFNFNTRFSDGFEDTFIRDGRSGSWLAVRDTKENYLQKIKDDLNALLCYQVDRHYLSFPQKIGDELINIWVFETEREDGYMVYSKGKGTCKGYTVYYKGDYRFEMRKIAGAWQAKTVRHRNPEVIDENLVIKIGKIIDAKIKE